MLIPCLHIAPTQSMGLGVFTAENIPAGTLIEVAPVIVMSQEERKLLDQTRLHDYIFEWGHNKDQCCMALGYVPIYNHSYQSNCEYEMDFERNQVEIRTVKEVRAGEQLFINYNGDWDDTTPLWFEAM